MFKLEDAVMVQFGNETKQVLFFPSRPKMREFAQANVELGKRHDFGQESESGKRWAFILNDPMVVETPHNDAGDVLQDKTTLSLNSPRKARYSDFGNHLTREQDCYNINKFGDKLYDKPVKVYKKKHRVMVRNMVTGAVLLDSNK